MKLMKILTLLSIASFIVSSKVQSQTALNADPVRWDIRSVYMEIWERDLFFSLLEKSPTNKIEILKYGSFKQGTSFSLVYDREVTLDSLHRVYQIFELRPHWEEAKPVFCTVYSKDNRIRYENSGVLYETEPIMYRSDEEGRISKVDVLPYAGEITCDSTDLEKSDYDSRSNYFYDSDTKKLTKIERVNRSNKIVADVTFTWETQNGNEILTEVQKEYGEEKPEIEIKFDANDRIVEVSQDSKRIEFIYNDSGQLILELRFKEESLISKYEFS